MRSLTIEWVSTGQVDAFFPDMPYQSEKKKHRQTRDEMHSRFLAVNAQGPENTFPIAQHPRRRFKYTFSCAICVPTPPFNKRKSKLINGIGVMVGKALHSTIRHKR